MTQASIKVASPSDVPEACTVRAARGVPSLRLGQSPNWEDVIFLRYNIFTGESYVQPLRQHAGPFKDCTSYARTTLLGCEIFAVIVSLTSRVAAIRRTCCKYRMAADSEQLGNGSLFPDTYRLCALIHIALEEAGAVYTLSQIDVIHNKPEWYKRVNPLGKVPALTFGGPHVPPEEPSPESAKLVESLALLEFVADLFPESGLLPADPVLRARARTFIALYHSYVHDELTAVFFRGTPGVDAFLQGLETLQNALPPKGLAAGEWSLAEAGVAPFLARMRLYLEAGLGKYSDADGEAMRAALASARFTRLRQYMQDVRARPSFAETWGGDAVQAEAARDIPFLYREA